jgi:hypothetical protein
MQHPLTRSAHRHRNRFRHDLDRRIRVPPFVNDLERQNADYRARTTHPFPHIWSEFVSHDYIYPFLCYAAKLSFAFSCVSLFSLLQRLPPFRRIGASRIHVHAFIETKCHLGREISSMQWVVVLHVFVMEKKGMNDCAGYLHGRSYVLTSL